MPRERDLAELDFVADALSREGTGRLYKQLVYDQRLAQSVRAENNGAQFSSVFQVTVQLAPDADENKVREIVLAEVARIVKEPLAAKEMQRLVAAREAGTIRSLQSLNARANTLQGYNHFLGDPGKLTWDLDRYRNATPDQVRAIAAKYLLPDRVVTIVTTPKAGAK